MRGRGRQGGNRNHCGEKGEQDNERGRHKGTQEGETGGQGGCRGTQGVTSTDCHHATEPQPQTLTCLIPPPSNAFSPLCLGAPASPSPSPHTVGFPSVPSAPPPLPNQCCVGTTPRPPSPLPPSTSPPLTYHPPPPLPSAPSPPLLPRLFPNAPPFPHLSQGSPVFCQHRYTFLIGVVCWGKRPFCQP